MYTYREVLVVRYKLAPRYLQWRRDHEVRPSDGKVRIKLVTSTCTISCNVLSQDNTRQTRPLPLLTD
jgi:hypothetical protein